MIEHAIDHFPWLAKLNANARESIYQFVMFGMTAPKLINTQTVMTAIAVGVISAAAGAFLTVQNTASRVDALSGQLLRIEKMIETAAEINRVHQLTDETRLSRIEGALFHNPVQSGMSGMIGPNGDKRAK